MPLVPGATCNDVLRKIPPHLVLDPTDEMKIMQVSALDTFHPPYTKMHTWLFDLLLRFKR